MITTKNSTSATAVPGERQQKITRYLVPGTCFFLYTTTFTYEDSSAINPFRTVQSRFGDKLLENRVVCPHNGTAVL